MAAASCFSGSSGVSSCINCCGGPTIKGGSIKNSLRDDTASTSSSSISDESDIGADAAEEDDVSSSGMVEILYEAFAANESILMLLCERRSAINKMMK